MRKICNSTLLGTVLLLSTVACGGGEDLRSSRYLPSSYPDARKDGTIEHYVWSMRTGEKAGMIDSADVEDPYRWLEDMTSPETQSWISAQQKTARDYFSRIPYKEAIHDRLVQLNNYERANPPRKAGERYFFTKNTGLQEQPVIYVQESLNAKADVLFDPNTYAPGKNVVLDNFQLSSDGTYATICLHIDGSQWYKLLVMDISKRMLLEDEILGTRQFTPIWHGTGFYYGRYMEIAKEGTEKTDEANNNADESDRLEELHERESNQKVYFHEVGQPQSNDRLVFENASYSDGYFQATLSCDEKYLFLQHKGFDRGNTLYFVNLQDSKCEIKLIATDARYYYEPVDVIDGRAYVHSNFHYKRGRLLYFDVNEPNIRQWKSLVPEKEHVLADVQATQGYLILTYREDAADRAYLYDMDGNRRATIPVPGFGTINVSSKSDSRDIFFNFSSTTIPTTVYKYDAHTNSTVALITPKIDFKKEEYTTERVFATSADGTQIPLFLSYKKGIKFEGKTPTYLLAHGGFNLSMQPSFNINRTLLLEQGFIVAQVCTRGGNEYGSEWYTNGIRARKENVFADVIAAAEYLEQNGYTDAQHLCITGKNHGGMVAAVLANRRPDLFSVCIPRFSMFDLMRYQHFNNGWNWRYEFGTSRDSKEKFDYLIKFSPLQNIQSGDNVRYPAVLAITGDRDEEVLPCHSYKYMATLQAAKTGNEPKIVLIESNVGHSNKQLSQDLEESTNTYSFIFYNFGIKYK